MPVPGETSRPQDDQVPVIDFSYRDFIERPPPGRRVSTPQQSDHRDKLGLSGFGSGRKRQVAQAGEVDVRSRPTR